MLLKIFLTEHHYHDACKNSQRGDLVQLDCNHKARHRRANISAHNHPDGLAQLHDASIYKADHHDRGRRRALNNRRHQQADQSLVEAADKYAELEKEKATLEAEIARLREVHSQKLSKEAQKLMKMPFQRAITKKEQADMGKLKKSVRGLVVVHPMTALGREMGLQEMTGFSKTAF